MERTMVTSDVDELALDPRILFEFELELDGEDREPDEPADDWPEDDQEEEDPAE